RHQRLRRPAHGPLSRPARIRLPPPRRHHAVFRRHPHRCRSPPPRRPHHSFGTCRRHRRRCRNRPPLRLQTRADFRHGRHLHRRCPRRTPPPPHHRRPHRRPP